MTPHAAAPRCRVALVSTGGTIEKTYDELEGVLENKVSVLDLMLSRLQLDGIEIQRVPLMNKDSLEMTDEDHQRIGDTVARFARSHDGVVVVHGTDRLAVTGDHLHERFEKKPVPIVLNGAMRPYVMRTTDALQNLVEALLAVQLAPPGVYVAMHNKLLAFPGVQKDPVRGTFVRAGS